MAQSRLPPNFRRVRLELAREPNNPEGDATTAYVLTMPLDEQDRLDVKTAQQHRDALTVVRMRHDAEPVRGVLQRRPGGSWALHYEGSEARPEDDDPAYRLEQHRFTVGEYVTIMEEDGEHTYRVAWHQHV
jgi:hypothetical protein